MSNTMAEKIFQLNKKISELKVALPDNYGAINPYCIDDNNIKKITNIFYQKYYNDLNDRYLILGSSPARRKSAITSIPFEGAKHLEEISGINLNFKYINNQASKFLEEVIIRYGGYEKFYSKFYMNFVCPIGIIKNVNEKPINCNYYDNKKVEKELYPIIVKSLKDMIKIGINTSICFCIGSNQNYKTLLKINKEHHLFDKIIPLEHPRYIMQYNSKNRKEYLQKYLSNLNNV